MNTVKTWQTTSSSAADTEALASRLAHNLAGGEVILLVSDLGGGKTTFGRGLASGSGSKQNVSSPTFKISNEYTATKFTIYHFDFYRLPEAGLIANELAEVFDDPKAVTVIEWGDVVQDVLPNKRLSVDIKNLGTDSRKLTLTYPEELAYLLEGLDA